MSDTIKEDTEYSIAVSVFKQLTEDDISVLKETAFADLVQFHHTVGRWIRNHYNLWDYEWEPVVGSDGVDYSPNHPDAVSQRIIEHVWRHVNNGPQ